MFKLFKKKAAIDVQVDVRPVLEAIPQVKELLVLLVACNEEISKIEARSPKVDVLDNNGIG